MAARDKKTVGYTHLLSFLCLKTGVINGLYNLKSAHQNALVVVLSRLDIVTSVSIINISSTLLCGRKLLLNLSCTRSLLYRQGLVWILNRPH